MKFSEDMTDHSFSRSCCFTKICQLPFLITSKFLPFELVSSELADFLFSFTNFFRPADKISSMSIKFEALVNKLNV